MPTPYYGTPGGVFSAPTPAAGLLIASSTNTTPIVITTAAPHLLRTNQAVIINGHLVNTSANGVWLAVVLTSTTFSLKTFAGVASTPTAAGAATGTSQSLGLPGITLPEDAVDLRSAASVGVPLAGLADMVAWLAYKIQAANIVLPGGFSQVAGGRMVLSGGSRINIPVTRLTDADHTVSAADGPVFILAKPTAARTITIQQASDINKSNGDTLEFYMPIPPTADPASAYYALKREGSANNIGILWGKYFPAAGAGDAYPGFARVQLEAGVWRLAGGAGVNWDTDA